MIRCASREIRSAFQPRTVRMIARWVPAWLAQRAARLDAPQWLVHLLVRLPQRFEEMRARRQRGELLKRDTDAQRRLAFGRPTE